MVSLVPERDGGGGESRRQRLWRFHNEVSVYEVGLHPSLLQAVN